MNTLQFHPAPLPAPAPAPEAPKPHARLIQVRDGALGELQQAGAGCEQALQDADAVHRAMDDARLTARSIAHDKAADPAAAWQAARTKLAEAAARSQKLHTGLATEVSRPMQHGAKYIDYAAWSFGRNGRSSVKNPPELELVQESAPLLNDLQKAVELPAARFGLSLAAAVSDASKPVSKEQAASLAETLEEASHQLRLAEEQSDALRMGLARAIVDGRGFQSFMDHAIAQGGQTHPARNFAEELNHMVVAMQSMPTALRTINQTMQAAHPHATGARDAFTQFVRAARTFYEKGDAAARETALDALDTMKLELKAAEARVFSPQGADALLPLWADMRFPCARLALLPGDLQARDAETRWGPFHRQYRNVSNHVEPAVAAVAHAYERVDTQVARSLELKRTIQELTRLADTGEKLLAADPSVASKALKSVTDRADKLFSNLTLRIPEPPARGRYAFPGFLEQAADSLMQALPHLEAAAARAQQDGV